MRGTEWNIKFSSQTLTNYQFPHKNVLREHITITTQCCVYACVKQCDTMNHFISSARVTVMKGRMLGMSMAPIKFPVDRQNVETCVYVY